MQAFELQVHLSELCTLLVELLIRLDELIVLVFDLFVFQLLGSDGRVKIRNAFGEFIRVSLLAGEGFETFLFGLELSNPVFAKGLDGIQSFGISMIRY